MKFVIGHPAYSGPNRHQVVKTRGQAIDVLRDRGVKRDVARAVTKECHAASLMTMYGGPTGLDVIEVKQVDDSYVD